MRKPGRSLTNRTNLSASSQGKQPSRVIPVSILMCTSIILPALTAVRERVSASSFVKRDGTRLYSSRYGAYSRGVKPRINMGASIPLSRSGTASSSIPTHKAEAPAASAARATCTAPWPYPSALTVAISLTGEGIRVRNCRTLWAIALKSISAQVGRSGSLCNAKAPPIVTIHIVFHGGVVYSCR